MHLHPALLGAEARKGPEMYLIDQELARTYMDQRIAEAGRASRARRLASARRWTRRAERASQRAARANSAVW
jgi:cob(I)alamin adenosyltransferase